MDDTHGDASDDPTFAELDRKQVAEGFMAYLPDEAHRSVFWVVVMNHHSVAAAAQILGIGVKTCEAQLDKIEALWREYQERDLN